MKLLTQNTFRSKDLLSAVIKVVSQSASVPQKGFCPISQMTLGAVKAEEHIGQTYSFLITEIKSDELIVSRRRLIEQEREAKKNLDLQNFHPE